MEDKTTAALRARLQQELERLEAQVAALDAEERATLSEASGENNYRDHMADQGTATFERELDMTLEENLREQLQEVRNALARMDRGDYGVCDRCHGDIAPERLDAVPTAALCIACKAAEEAR